MMKKEYVLLVILILFLTSCSTMSLFNKQDIVLKNESVALEIGKKILVDMIIEDSIKTKFVFDTGATSSFVMDSAIFHLSDKEDHAKFGGVKDSQNESLKTVLFAVDAKNEIFDAKNKVFRFYPIQPTEDLNCIYSKRPNNISGFIGNDFFDNQEKLLFLNFSQNEMSIITHNDFKQLDKFKIVESDFKSFGSRIYIYLTINNHKYKMLFDTGNSVGIMLPNTEISNFESEYEVIYQEGVANYSITRNKKYQKAYWINDVDISLNENKAKNNILFTDRKNYYNVGLNFIKRFDWILDYKNQKVYAKHNKIDNEEKTIKDKIVASIENDKLFIITTRGKFTEQYNIGDEIISINGEKINSNNICDKLFEFNINDNQHRMKFKIKKQ